MNQKKTDECKSLISPPTGPKCVRPVRQFVETGTMYIGVNDALQIKENSP